MLEKKWEIFSSPFLSIVIDDDHLINHMTDDEIRECAED